MGAIDADECRCNSGYPERGRLVGRAAGSGHLPHLRQHGDDIRRAYYRINPGGANPSQTSHVAQNLDPNQTYYFVVTAEDRAGNESLWSAEVSASPLP